MKLSFKLFVLIAIVFSMVSCDMNTKTPDIPLTTTNSDEIQTPSQTPSDGDVKSDWIFPNRYYLQDVIRWINNNDPSVDPHDFNKPMVSFVDFQGFCGDWDYVFESIKLRGLPVFLDEQGELVEFAEKSIELFPSHSQYNLGAIYIINGRREPMYFTYVPQNDIPEIESNVIEYLYSTIPLWTSRTKDEAIANGKFLYTQIVTIEINGENIPAVSCEYVDEAYYKEQGYLIFVYRGIRFEMFNPYSDPKTQEGLKTVTFEVINDWSVFN